MHCAVTGIPKYRTKDMEDEDICFWHWTYHHDFGVRGPDWIVRFTDWWLRNLCY